MNIEQYSDHISRQLAKSSRTFRTALRTVVTSSDYAHAIGSLAREILATDAERKLWLDRFGLVYCAFIIPSHFFAVPIKALFSTEGELCLAPPDRYHWGTESLDRDNFFNLQSSCELVQVQFLQDDGVLRATARESRRRPGNLVLVSKDFLRYLEEPRDPDCSPLDYYNTADPRFEIFMSRNQKTIRHIFNLGKFEVCPALEELASIRELSGSRSNYICLIPCADGLHHGVFCYFFRRTVGGPYRILLRSFSYLLFTYCRSIDRSEYQRRATNVETAVSHEHSAFHAMRNALGALQNKLQVLRLNQSSHVDGGSTSHLEGALECHDQVLSHLNRVETIALSPPRSDGDVTTLRTLADLLLGRSEQKARRKLRFHLDRDHIDEHFELPSSVPELVQALSQFIDGALNAEEEPPEGDQTSEIPSVYLDLFIMDQSSELCFSVNGSADWPTYIQEAMQSVNLLGRLPSIKVHGGRGILSAIELIRNQYQGECKLTEISIFGNLNPFWEIKIPIKINRQLHLFYSTKTIRPQGEAKVMASILCVDDNEVFLKSMAERLRAEHYEVDQADSPGAALTAFKLSPFKYDVVITDMEFPSGDDGETLIAELVELREKRGYDPAPEIICITGARSKMDPTLINRLRDKGCQYVLKGTDQYFVETQAAMERLHDVRTKGPTFLFVHAAAEEYRWDDTQKWGCVVGESVAEVCLLHSGRRIKVELGPAPRRLFDFLARRASARAFSVEEVANALSLDEFYNYWESGDETVTSNSVKTNVNRIRVALRATFKGMNLPFKPSNVLSSETFEDTTEPLLEKTRFYRFRARAVVEHLP